MNEQISVKLGCCVEVKLVSRSGSTEQLAFDLVSDSQADFENGFLSVSTPLAKAILGETVGNEIPYFTSDLQAVKILSISISTREPDKNIAKKREEILKETLHQINYRDAVLFASSTETKWGGYDADGLNYVNWKSKTDTIRDDPDEIKGK